MVSYFKIDYDKLKMNSTNLKVTAKKKCNKPKNKLIGHTKIGNSHI